MSTSAIFAAASLAALGLLANAASGIETSTFTVPGAFPTSVYQNYYNSPTATSAQVQPIISDPVTVRLVLLL